MKKFEFTIIASGLDPEAPDFENRFFEAGCDDAIIAFVKGRIVIEFEREAKNFSHALAGAIQDVRQAGATPEHIEPDYLVSLSDIAERCNLSKAAISLYAKGARGRSFPAPIVRLTTDSPLWDWVQVSSWMYREGKALTLETVVEAKVVRDANRALFEAQGRFESRFGQKFLEQVEAA